MPHDPRLNIVHLENVKGRVYQVASITLSIDAAKLSGHWYFYYTGSVALVRRSCQENSVRKWKGPGNVKKVEVQWKKEPSVTILLEMEGGAELGKVKRARCQRLMDGCIETATRCLFWTLGVNGANNKCLGIISGSRSSQSGRATCSDPQAVIVSS